MLSSLLKLWLTSLFVFPEYALEKQRQAVQNPATTSFAHDDNISGYSTILTAENLLVCLFLVLLLLASLTFYSLHLKLRLQTCRNQLVRYHAKHCQQHETIARQEIRIKELEDKQHQLQESQRFFLTALSDDLSNPVTVIKNHYIEWFQQSTLKPDALEKAMATDSCIGKIEQLIQRAQIAALSDVPKSHNQTAETCNLNAVLHNLLHYLRSESVSIETQGPIDQERHYQIPAQEQALMIFLSFYLNLLLRHLNNHNQLRLNIAEQQDVLCITIDQSASSGGFSCSPEPEKESGFFLIRDLSARLSASARFAAKQQPSGLLTIQFRQFTAGYEENPKRSPEYSPHIYFDTHQEAVLNKNGPAQDSPRCLILDPCPEIQMCLTQELSQYFHCKGVFSLDAGLKKLLEWQPDVLIIEPVQGVEDAFDALKSLAGQLDMSRLQVIVITSRDTIKIRLRALEFNIHSFFSKPFNKQLVLSSAINLHQQRTRQQQYRELQENVPFQQSRDAIFLAQLNRLVEQQIDNPDFRFEDYFAQFALSKRQFFRRVNTLTRCTPKQYLIQKRLELARHLLTNGCMLEAVAQRCGFKTAQSLMKIYRAHFGEAPV